MWIILTLLIPIAIFSCFALLTLIVTFFESRYVWILEPLSSVAVAEPERWEPPHENPYQPPTSPALDLPLTAFATANSHEFESLGYVYLDSFRHVKGGMYQIRYDAWLSSDRYLLALIESGSLMKMPVTNLSILTLGEQIADTPPRRSAGATVCIESFTNEKALAPNLVGVLDSMLFPSASARKADELHRQRLAWVQPRRFSEDPLGDYHRFRLQEAQAIQERGLCRFVDDQQNVWLPTFAGALRIYVHMYWFMVSRRIYSDRWRLKRMVKRRGKQGDLS